jgi:Spy/CpxP family protein refolding chaperone
MKGSSNRILTIAVVLLLLVNVAMLVFMLKGRSHYGGRSSGRGNPMEMMAKELKMTEQQQTEFKKLREEHFKTIGPVFDSIKTLKKSLFELVKKEDASDSTITKYSSLIAEQQAVIDKATIKHFRTTRALFTGDQQKQFDEFVEKMMQRRMTRPGGWQHDSSGKR